MGSGSSWLVGAGDEVVPGIRAERKLGGGERYEAYLGWHERMFAPVVVKVVRPDLVADSATMRGLRREVEMLHRLSHPVIVRSFDADLEGERPHVVLEHLDGPRLSSLLRRFGPLSMEQLLPLGLELCSALHYLSTERVVHLDVKPSNIIMGAPPRLIDLSIARSLEAAARLDHVTGTDAYLAPEQADPARGRPPASPADIFGLGVTLYEGLTGVRPFPRGSRDQDASPEDTWPQLVEAPAPLPGDIPGFVATPILECLDPDPASRPTAAELAGRLQPLVEALPRPVLGALRARMR